MTKITVNYPTELQKGVMQLFETSKRRNRFNLDVVSYELEHGGLAILERLKMCAQMEPRQTSQVSLDKLSQSDCWSKRGQKNPLEPGQLTKIVEDLLKKDQDVYDTRLLEWIELHADVGKVWVEQRGFTEGAYYLGRSKYEFRDFRGPEGEVILYTNGSGLLCQEQYQITEQVAPLLNMPLNTRLPKLAKHS
ncbi:MAG: hypothetical protein AAF569_04260 [Pseudomonadota bacterium]